MLQALAQLRWNLPADASAHGPALDRHLLLNLWIALTLLALAHALLLAGLIRRRSAKPPRKLLLETLPLAALTVLFAGLGLRAQSLWAAERYTGASLTALQIEATGMQFAWYFRYPGDDQHFGRTDLALAKPYAGNPLGLDPADSYAADDFVTSQLVIPANREVDLTLVAQDVIHGFAVPELRVKQNAIPGQTTHIHFTATAPGSYAILCTQLCGSGHYRMNATLRVVSQQDFDRWLSQHEAAK